VEGQIKVFRPAELRVRSRVPLKYPAAARSLELGDHRCLAKVFIDEGGVPYDVLVEGCPEAFFQDTRGTILEWRWNPPMDQGGPTRAMTTLAVTYRMSE
jgi:hypothetical protein